MTIFHAAVAVLDKGAAYIYHNVLATGAHITAWEASNPAIADLVAAGVAHAEAAMLRFGIPVGMVTVAADDIVAALRAMAALDATVPSVTVPAPAAVTSIPVGDANAPPSDVTSIHANAPPSAGTSIAAETAVAPPPAAA